MLPCIAGHVGADTAGMLLAEAPQAGEAVQLLVDVGTNAEIVLGNRDRLLAASSPTGPAFEGAQIEAGQRAAPGAIERVRIDSDSLEPRFRVCRAGRAGRGYRHLRFGHHRGRGRVVSRRHPRSQRRVSRRSGRAQPAGPGRGSELELPVARR